MEAAAYDYFAKIDELGGMVEAVKQQLPPARDRRRLLRAAEPRSTHGDRVVVGVNRYHRGRRRPDARLLRIDPALERKQIDRVQAVRARRDGAAVEQALAALREAAARTAPT